MFPRTDTKRLATIVKDIDDRDMLDNLELWFNFCKMCYGPYGVGSNGMKN